MRGVSTSVWALVLVCVLGAGCGGGGGKIDSSSPTAPTNPKNTNLTGTWTGTLSRPSGLSPIAITWVATQSGASVTGPISMTYNGVTVQASVDGGFLGGDSSVAQAVGFRIVLNAGGSSVSPTCAILANGNISSLAAGATSFASDAFKVAYSNCKGFIENDPGAAQHTDASSVLTLTKQ